MAMLGPQVGPDREPQYHEIMRNKNHRATLAQEQRFAPPKKLEVVGPLFSITEAHSLIVQNKFGDRRNN